MRSLHFHLGAPLFLSTLRYGGPTQRLVLVVQCGNAPAESPQWVSTARPFLLGSLLCGYFVSAALFLTSARLMKRDILKLETVMQSGSLDAVCIDP